MVRLNRDTGIATLKNNYTNTYLGFEAPDPTHPIPALGASLASSIYEVQCLIKFVHGYGLVCVDFVICLLQSK